MEKISARQDKNFERNYADVVKIFVNARKRKAQKVPLNRGTLSLGELFETVSSLVEDSHEAVAEIAHLFQSGRVRVFNHGKFKRVFVAFPKKMS